MLDVAPTELLLVAVVAVVVIGPKDLPRAMRFVGHWMGRARGVARQFRSGFDEMIRESELADMEKKWADENARIMSMHPTPSATLPSPDTADGEPVQTAQPAIVDDGGMIDNPVVEPVAPTDVTPPELTKAPS